MNITVPPQVLLYMVLTVLSHIGASLFFAKPRYGKIPTALLKKIFAVLVLYSGISMVFR